MSRIGKKPISIPEGVKVQLSGTKLHIEGPKGKMDLNVHPRMNVTVEGTQVVVNRPTNTNQDRSLHGLTRTLISNVITGVTQEFSKALEIEGIGFKAQLQGKSLQLNLGFSHPINFAVPEGISTLR